MSSSSKSPSDVNMISGANAVSGVKVKKIASVAAQCVACGVCAKACPLGAISAAGGHSAAVSTDKCVGCGRCAAACPAGVISMIPRPAPSPSDGGPTVSSAPAAGSSDRPATGGSHSGSAAGSASSQAADVPHSAPTAGSADRPAAGSADRPAAASLKSTATSSGPAFPSARGAGKHWYDYLWIASALYLTLGFFNILFAWLGLICFLVPLLLAIFGGGKVYCHKYCGRGQLFSLLGGKLRLSAGRPAPAWLRSRWFRYGFLAFFMTMFANMLYTTWLVFSGARTMHQIVTLLWTFKLPWNWVSVAGVASWAAQFAFGFYSVMLTSTVLGLITMALFRPRSWCVYCPMGTMTQEICRLKNRGGRR